MKGKQKAPDVKSGTIFSDNYDSDSFIAAEPDKVQKASDKAADDVGDEGHSVDNSSMEKNNEVAAINKVIPAKI